MKKITIFILVTGMLMCTATSVSARIHDNHYDFYGKAGPTTQKNVIEKVTIDVAVCETYQINRVTPVSFDVGISAQTKVKPVQISTTTNESAEASNGDLYIRRRPERPLAPIVPDPGRQKLKERLKEVIRPPIKFDRIKAMVLIPPLE